MSTTDRAVVDELVEQWSSAEPGEFRGTLLAVHKDDTWHLAALRLSPLGWRPPGMPAGEPPVANTSTTTTTTTEQD